MRTGLQLVLRWHRLETSGYRLRHSGIVLDFEQETSGSKNAGEVRSVSAGTVRVYADKPCGPTTTSDTAVDHERANATDSACDAGNPSANNTDDSNDAGDTATYARRDS
jgi:hypothetical protein